MSVRQTNFIFVLGVYVHLNIHICNVAFFDDELHATGVLTSNLSVDAEAIRGASGAVFGNFTTAFSTLIAGTIVGLVNSWKLALVALTTLPLLIAAGTLRFKILTYFKVKAQRAYERSSQLACEAVAAIRTVQSLTRETDVHAIYLQMLEEPLKDGFRNAYLNTLLFGCSQATNFVANALGEYQKAIKKSYSSPNLLYFHLVFWSSRVNKLDILEFDFSFNCLWFMTSFHKRINKWDST